MQYQIIHLIRKSILVPFLLIGYIIPSYSQSNRSMDLFNAYSIDLYKKLLAPAENLFFSPISIYSALSIPYEGARNHTKKQFDSLFHIINPIDHDQVIDFSNRLVSFRDYLEYGYFSISNAVWIQNSFKLDSLYTKKILKKYQSSIISVDFADQIKSAEQINKWIAEKTKNRILEIINHKDIHPETKFIVSNAIYFIGQWEKKFSKTLTKPDVFYSIEKEKKEIDFMNTKEKMKYVENYDFQMITKSYEGDDKLFCVILPFGRYKIQKVESKLTQELISEAFNNMKYEEVNLSLPKFKLEYSYSLIKPLQQLGLQDAFTSKADFSDIATGNEVLMIDDINHKAYIDINEERTEAAAVTEVKHRSGSGVGLRTEPVVFKANHPFIFMIVDERTKGIIFMGRYVSPRN